MVSIIIYINLLQTVCNSHNREFKAVGDHNEFSNRWSLEFSLVLLDTLTAGRKS